LKQLIRKNKKWTQIQISQIFDLVLSQTNNKYLTQNIDNIICFIDFVDEINFDKLFDYILIVMNYLKNNFNEKLINYKFNEINSTELSFVCDLYHSSLKAIHILLQKFKSLKSQNLNQLIESEVLLKFVNLIECQIFQIKVTPIGCLITASHVLCLIFNLNEKNFDYIISYINENHLIDEKWRLALISSSYQTFPALQLNDCNLFYDFKTFKQLITYKNRNDSQFLILHSHLLFNWTQVIIQILNINNSKELSTFEKNINQKESIALFSDEVIVFIENNFDSSIDQIEHIFKNYLVIKQSLLTTDQLKDYLLRLYSQFNCKSKNNLSKYRLLTYIYQTIGAKDFLNIFNALIDNLFEEIKLLLIERNDGLNEIIYFISVIITLPDKQIVEKWKNHICLSILNEDFSHHKNQKNLMLSAVMPKLIKKHSNFVKSIVNDLIKNYDKLNSKQLLHVIKLKKTLDDNFSNDPFYNECLNRTISHFEEEIRLDSLSLIIESRKTTQLLNETEIKLIHISISYNIHFQESSSRQRFVALIKKFFQRLVDSLKTNIKASNFHQIQNQYNLLIDFIIKYSLENLRPTNYFGTTLTLLQILQLISSLLLPNDYLFSIIESIEIKSYFMNLINILSDSFEENKICALQVLIKFFNLKLFAITVEELSLIKKIAISLSESVNPSDSLTAAYLFKLIVNIEVFCDKNKIKLHSCYDLIYNLLEEINHFVEMTNKDIVLSSAKYPLYTKLSCIRAIINEVEFVSIPLEEIEIWKQLIEKVINICYLSSEAVKSIVCNDSPEGHLPMDCQPITEEFISKLLNFSLEDISTEKASHITSQMLLLCGWKTIKESAWLLAQLCQSVNKCDLHNDSGNHIINCEQTFNIIEFLYSNLMELKHRGAFEQTASAFTLLIENVWNNKCKCSIKVVQILETIVQNLHNEQELEIKGCVTRRSAGLPFVIQAALSGEPSIHNNKYFNYTITELLKILSKESSKEWQIIHCLNILRALIRDHRMIEKINPFVEESVKVSLIKFKSTSFAVRNCASMQFNSLIVRIFGVKRNKEDNSKKNKMSSRLFFMNYPSLFDFLLQEIAICSQFENQFNNFSNVLHIESSPLYPLLLLLSKLMPSISPTNIYDMNAFLPYLKSICLNCRHYKLRILSSKIFAQLIQESEIEEHINDSFDNLINMSNISENKLHGLSHLLSEIIPIAPKQLYENIVSKLNESIAIVLVNHLNEFSYNSLSSFIYLIEISSIKQMLTFNDKSNISKLLLSIWTNETAAKQRSNILKPDEYLVFLAKSIVVCVDSNEERIKFLKLLFSNTDRSCREAKLIVLKLIIDSVLNDKKLFCDIAQEISYESVFSVPSITLPNIQQIISGSFYDLFFTTPEINELINSINELSNNQELSSRVRTFSASSYAFLAETFRLLYYSSVNYQIKVIPLFKSLGNNVEELRFFINGFNLIADDDLKYSILLTSSRLLTEITENNDYNKLNEYLSNGLLEEWAQIVNICSTEDQSMLSRKIVVKILKQTLKKFTKIIHLNGEYVINLWKALINLIQDNDIDIRRQSVEVVMIINERNELIVSQKALEICVEMFSQNVSSFDIILCIYCLSKWMIETNENFDCYDSDDRLFDKSKLNIYANNILFIDILAKQLQSILNRQHFHINDLKLPLDLLMNSFSNQNFLSNEEAINRLSQILSNEKHYNLEKVFLDSSCDYKSLSKYKRLKLINVLLNKL
jgi:hypothetical protein